MFSTSVPAHHDRLHQIMVGQHQRPLHQCLHTMIGQHHRSPHQRLHIHHDQTASTFARAVVACTCVSATSIFAATDFNVCRSSGGTYMCVSSINICCVGQQRLQEQWWHVILQKHERLLQQCRHVTICSTNAFCGGASMSCSGINAFCSGAITSAASTYFPRTRRHLAASGFHTTTATRAGTMRELWQYCMLPYCLHATAVLYVPMFAHNSVATHVDSHCALTLPA